MAAEKTDFTTLEDRNNVELCGNIVSINITRNRTAMTMAVNAGGAQAYPVVTISSQKLLDGIRVRDNIRVQAHMRTWVQRDDTGKRVFLNIIEADSIEKRYRALNEYINIPETRNINGGMPDDVNEAFLVGKVDHIFIPNKDNRNIVILTMAMGDGDAANRTEVSCFQRQAARVIHAQKGDTIIVSGSVRTSQREEDRGREIQNIICKDVLLIPTEKEAENSAVASEGWDNSGVVQKAAGPAAQPAGGPEAPETGTRAEEESREETRTEVNEGSAGDGGGRSIPADDLLSKFLS